MGAFFQNFHKLRKHKGCSKNVSLFQPHAIPTIIGIDDCALTMLVPTFTDFDCRNLSQTLQWLYRQKRKLKPHHFGARTNGSHNLVDSVAMQYRTPRYTLIARCVSLFKITGTVPTLIGSAMADQHRSQVPKDQRRCTGIRHF